MYPGLLAVHNLLRWFVVIGVLVVFVRSVAGARAGRPFEAVDQKIGLAGIVAVDVQLLLGAALYFFSPRVSIALADMGAAMKNAELRYWAVEHLLMMLGVVICLHVGRIRSRRAPLDSQRHRSLAVYYGIALLIVLAAVPWPFRADIGRPLLPF